MGYTDFNSRIRSEQNDKAFMKWVAENHKVDTLIEISKDVDASNDEIKERVRHRKLNKLTDEGNTQN
jgi:hypothetical protein